MHAVFRSLLLSRRLINRDKSLKVFSYVHWSGFMLDNYCRLSKNGFVLYFGIRRRPFINKERVEKVKMASQQMPSALRLFLDLASALRVFLPFKGLYGVYQRIEG
ncbi:Uncharacterized protein FWK35_00012786 [Aphis craccivora]|uniref:Uncharacterized protein n=1 Tax=Aphis craccivora TaxID=307492 RepID=A0A6G0YPB3_APHCR|nr:Uncharacterized protein FWK35_00012786 [Aphis craccivora]